MDTVLAPPREPGLPDGAIEGICGAVCERVTSLLLADGACVTVRASGGTLRALACAGVLRPLAGATFPERPSVSGTALRSGGPYIDNELRTSETGSQARGVAVDLTSALAVPLDGRDSPLGALVVVNKRGPEGFGARDAEVLSAFAEPTALALRGLDLLSRARADVEHEASLRLETESFVRQLSTLHEAELSVAGGVELEEVLRSLVEAARLLTGAGRATLAVLCGDGRRIDRFVVSPEDGRTEPPPTGCETCPLPHVTSDEVALSHRRTGRFLRTPLVLDGSAFGNLCLTEPDSERGFTDRDEALVRMLAAQASVMIQKAELLAERADMIAQLEASTRARLRLSAYVNHDIRNALQGAVLWVERMARRLPGVDRDEVVLEAVDRVDGSLRHALRLVRDILDLTALEAGQLGTWPRAFGVPALLTSVTELMRPQAEAREVRMLVECEDGLQLVADPDRVRQIVLNLVSNAVKFSTGPSGVWITARRGRVGPVGEEGPWATISVRDEGPGIPPEEVERVFQPFERAHADATRREGTGLGLTISSQLAEHMGGSLTVDAEGGVGSTFTLWLPGDEPPERRPGWLG